jgi:hypothetical protein
MIKPKHKEVFTPSSKIIINEFDNKPTIHKFKSQTIKNDIMRNNISSDQVSYRKIMDKSISE